jgi:hypothetical protein
MCGICGATGHAGLGSLRRMTAALTHRGPDAQGFFEAPGTALAIHHLVERHPRRGTARCRLTVHGRRPGGLPSAKQTPEKLQNAYSTPPNHAIVGCSAESRNGNSALVTTWMPRCVRNLNPKLKLSRSSRRSGILVTSIVCGSGA